MKLIKRIKFKWLKIIRYGSRIERLNKIRVSETRKKKQRERILGKKRKLEQFEDGKKRSYGNDKIKRLNRIRVRRKNKKKQQRGF